MTCEALHQLLILLAKKRPLLWVIDIILWCDDATIDFLAYLCDRDFYKKYGLLILCSRKEESNRKVEIFTDRYLVEGLIERIEVPQLTNEETALLIQKMTGFDVQKEFIQKFYRDTGGNPYFLVEGLKSLLSLKFDFENYSTTSLYPTPDTIKALISEKTRVLTDNARKVLQAASVLGQFFMPEVVEAMEELSVAEMISALEELEKASIISIRQSPEIGTGYFFDHDQIREVVLQLMSPLRKRHLHLEAVESLIRVFGHKAELESTYAYHYEEAGEPAKAFNAWLDAAEFARTRFSKSDRYNAYEKTFNLINRLPQDRVVAYVDDLVNKWGNYAFDLTDGPTCQKIYNMCLEIGEQTQNPILLCDAWNGISRVHDINLDLDAGLDAVSKAQFYCDRIDNLSLKLETLARFALLTGGKNEIHKSIEYCEKALVFEPLVKSEREMDAMVNIQVQLGLMYLISGWPKKTIEIGERALNMSLLVKRRSAKVQAAAVLGAGLYYCGDYQKSLQNALAVRDLAERLNFRWWLSFLDVLIGRNHLALGDMDKSWASSQSALERELPYKNNGAYALAVSLAAENFHLLGDDDHAGQILVKGLSLEVKGYQSLDNAILYGRLIGSVDAKSGLQLFNEIFEQAEQFGLGLISLQARIGSCLFSILADQDITRCETEIEEIETDLTERHLGIYWMAEYARAQGATRSGKLTEARSYFTSLAGNKKTSANLWAKLHGVYWLTCLSDSEVQKMKYRKELISIFQKISEKATLPPLRKRLYVLRKKMLNAC